MAATITSETGRHVSCDGAFNLRDMGGYPTSDGATVRWRMLFRADGLHRVPHETMRSLPPMAWRTVLDLRTLDEHESGCFRSDGIDVVHLPVLRSTWDASSFDATTDPAEFLAARYLDMLDEGAPALATAFQVLAAASRLPAVFHCSAGKDRTGVLAALLLSALGVDDDHIAEDYALSALGVERLVAWIRTSRPEVTEHTARQPAAFLACPPAAIRTFLAELRHRHGSVEAYLRGIGVQPEDLTRLHLVLLEH